jgi:transposase-like protein
MVTIATFNEPVKARQLKRRFQDTGLKADVHNEAPLQQVGFMSRPQANAKVMVEDNDFERAQSLMVEWEATDPDIAAALIRCPQCGSSNIEYPQMTRKFITPALVGVLCAMKIIPKEFYCQDCHFTWSNEEERTLGRLWHLYLTESKRVRKHRFWLTGAIDSARDF